MPVDERLILPIGVPRARRRAADRGAARRRAADRDLRGEQPARRARVARRCARRRLALPARRLARRVRRRAVDGDGRAAASPPSRSRRSRWAAGRRGCCSGAREEPAAPAALVLPRARARSSAARPRRLRYREARLTFSPIRASLTVRRRRVVTFPHRTPFGVAYFHVWEVHACRVGGSGELLLLALSALARRRAGERRKRTAAGEGEHLRSESGRQTLNDLRHGRPRRRRPGPAGHREQGDRGPRRQGQQPGRGLQRPGLPRAARLARHPGSRPHGPQQRRHVRRAGTRSLPLDELHQVREHRHEAVPPGRARPGDATRASSTRCPSSRTRSR